MKQALSLITKKNLGVLIAINKKKLTTGIITDGDIKRLSNLNENYQSLIIKKVMKKNPISVDKDMLAAEALSIMNTKKITSLLVNNKQKRLNTIGVIHVHTILQTNIS